MAHPVYSKEILLKIISGIEFFKNMYVETKSKWFGKFKIATDNK